MTLKDWKSQLRGLEGDVEATFEAYERAVAKRDEFLKQTVGFKSRDIATLSGTIEMIEKIIDMKKEE
jgi:hypothetical protein